MHMSISHTRECENRHVTLIFNNPNVYYVFFKRHEAQISDHRKNLLWTARLWVCRRQGTNHRVRVSWKSQESRINRKGWRFSQCIEHFQNVNIIEASQKLYTLFYEYIFVWNELLWNKYLKLKKLILPICWLYVVDNKGNGLTFTTLY